MRTLIQKQTPTQPTKTPVCTTPDHTQSSPVLETHPMHQLQRSIGNQAIRRMLQADTEPLDARTALSSPTGFIQGIWRKSVYGTSPEQAQPKRTVGHQAEENEDVSGMQDQDTSSHSATLGQRTIEPAQSEGIAEGLAPRSDTIIDRKGCQPGAVIVSYDKKGTGCNARVKINIATHRCVKKCSDKARLAEISSLGRKACADFCLKQKASASHFTSPNQCTSKSCDATPGECPIRCPKLNRCHSAPRINAWNCKCGCVGIS